MFLQGYRVRFDRQARSEAHVFPDPPRVTAVEWSLEPKATSSSFVWCVRSVPKLPVTDFTSDQLARQIVLRLIEYEGEYNEAHTLR
jgi:hypothetical protein